jgi:hypothetical protein
MNYCLKSGHPDGRIIDQWHDWFTAWTMSEGWRLRAGWVAEVGETAVAIALHTDLAVCGEPVLPPDLASGVLHTPIVLQVVKVKNVSAPCDNQASQHTPRMLKLQLTDGHLRCFGLELAPIKVCWQKHLEPPALQCVSDQ